MVNFRVSAALLLAESERWGPVGFESRDPEWYEKSLRADIGWPWSFRAPRASRGTKRGNLVDAAKRGAVSWTGRPSVAGTEDTGFLSRDILKPLSLDRALPEVLTRPL